MKPYTTHSPTPSDRTPASATRALLLVTRLAPGVTAAAVADIFKGARDRHRQLAITGTMLFDGERFGVLLCGMQAAVGTAFDAIACDPRHAPPVVLADGPCIPPWAAQNWRSGWSEPDALAPLDGDEATRDRTALDIWCTLVSAGDLL